MGPLQIQSVDRAKLTVVLKHKLWLSWLSKYIPHYNQLNPSQLLQVQPTPCKTLNAFPMQLTLKLGSSVLNSPLSQSLSLHWSQVTQIQASKKMGGAHNDKKPTFRVPWTGNCGIPLISRLALRHFRAPQTFLTSLSCYKSQ